MPQLLSAIVEAVVAVVVESFFKNVSNFLFFVAGSMLVANNIL